MPSTPATDRRKQDEDRTTISGRDSCFSVIANTVGHAAPEHRHACPRCPPRRAQLAARRLPHGCSPGREAPNPAHCPTGDAAGVPDVPGISRLSRWSGAPAAETSMVSRLARLQQATRSDSGSCGGDTVGVQVPLSHSAPSVAPPGARAFARGRVTGADGSPSLGRRDVVRLIRCPARAPPARSRGSV
jgi:hypothetical protein